MFTGDQSKTGLYTSLVALVVVLLSLMTASPSSAEVANASAPHTSFLGSVDVSANIGIIVVPPEVPQTAAVVRLEVVGPAPQHAVVLVALSYMNSNKKWQLVGRDSTSGPWITGGKAIYLSVTYPCLRSGLRWRLLIVWDGATHGGKVESGQRYDPSSRGGKLTC